MDFSEVGDSRIHRLRAAAGGVLLIVALALPGKALSQSDRLLDPEADAEVYRLVETVAGRVGPTESLVFTAKPWSTADVRAWIGEVGSLLVEEPDPWAATLVGYLEDAVGGRVAPDGGEPGAPTRVAGAAWLEASARLYGAAGEFELEPAFESVRERESLGTPSAVLEFGLRGGAGWPEWNLAGAVDLRALTDTRNRFDLRAEDDEAEVAVRSAYVTWQSGSWLVAAGRVPIEWGNGLARGLGMTATGPAQDGFLARAGLGRAQLTVFSAFLEDEPQNRLLDEEGDTIGSSLPDPAAPLQGVDRYLFGHRADVALSDRLSLGIEEMALVTGIRRHMPFGFATGLVPYFALQESREESDGVDINLGVGLEYRWRPVDPLTLYGAVFANEFFADPDVEEVLRGVLGRRSNTQAFQQGIRWADPAGIPGTAVRIEWARLEHFLYLHRGMNTNWQQDDVPLGSPLGPDVAQWSGRVEVVRPLGPIALLGELAVTRRRRGVARITDLEDVQRAGGNRPTPRGPDERWWMGEAAVRAFWPGVGEARLELTAGRIEDLHNLVGERLKPVSLRFSLTLREAWRHAL